MNVLKLYEHAPILFEIAKKYRELVRQTSAPYEDMSLADEIDVIQKDIEEE